MTGRPLQTETETETEAAAVAPGDARAVVLVEGVSDRIALETLAARRGGDLAADGVSIVAMGGAQAIGRFLSRFGASGSNPTVAGLCDAGEEEVFRSALERAGFGSHLGRADLERLGFFVCEPDLEAELIRAVGAARVESLLETYGDLTPFRTLQKQPEWRGRPVEDQLRRFMGSGGRRKIRFARTLVEALDPANLPRPLDAVLTFVDRRR